MNFDPQTAGKLYGKDEMLFLFTAGTAVGDDGEKYSMFVGGGQSPVVECDRTGKKFALHWEDILDLAVDRGIKED